MFAVTAVPTVELVRIGFRLALVNVFSSQAGLADSAVTGALAGAGEMSTQ
jgi:hypothetical protein